MNSRIEELGRLALKNERLSRPDAIYISQARDEDLHDLFYWAHKVRREFFGNEVKFCSIAAGKVGACSEDCKWCAQAACHSTAVSTKMSRATTTELASATRQAVEAGAASFGIVNSGRRPVTADMEAIEQAFSSLPDEVKFQRCASLGELDDATARKLHEIGVRRYNHNLESSRRFYSTVVTTHCYDDRLATLATAKRAGIGLCCGGIFGLGETWEDRIDLALTLRDEVGPEVVPLNFLHPIPGTAMQDVAPLAPLECLHIVAIFRLLLPKIDLKIAGGRHVNLRDLQAMMFYAGATSCLVGNYLTTLGRDPQADRQLVSDAGMRLVTLFSRERTQQADGVNSACSTQ